jgi:spermidine synthase
MRFTYDNSAANVRNPFQPPQRIVWGQNTTDEMGDLWLQVVPRTADDLRTLNDDINRKTHAEDLAAYTKVLETDPGNPLRHDAVAMLYLQEGKASDAVREYRESLRLNDQSAPTHYNLGLALSMQRAYGEAAAEFERAIALDPEYAEAHNNLGAMMHVSGKFDQAAVHYRRATELRPDNAEAFNNLGRLLTLQRKPAEAVASFARALALQPDAPSSLSGLAWLRATASDGSIRDASEATRLAERAASLTSRRDPSVLDTLAAAYAAGGRFDEAITEAREAMALASAAGMEPLWLEIRTRLKLYEQHTAYTR